MLLDEFAARFNLVAHQHAEELVGAADVFHANLQQRAVGRVKRRFPKLFGVHFAEAFKPGDVQHLLAGVADGSWQPAEVLEAGFSLAAAKRIAASFFAGPLLRNKRGDIEAELSEVGERGVNRADFVKINDPQPRRIQRRCSGRAVAVSARDRRIAGRPTSTFSLPPVSFSWSATNLSSSSRVVNHSSRLPKYTW